MKRNSIGFSCPCALALFFAVGQSASLYAQDTEKPVVPFEGTQAFAHVLDSFQLQPVKDLADLAELDPAATLIVVFGDTAILDDIAHATGGLNKFRKRGGALLIASDRDDRGRLKPLGLRIDGEPVYEVAARAYKQIIQCPLVMPGGHAQLFKGCRMGLATNRPSYVQGQVRLRGLHFLANYSQHCWVESGGNVQGAAFGVTGAEAGRLLVLAGHGVFMNGMIAQPDCDNWTFAWNSVRWLSAGTEDSRRKHALFVEDGQIRSSFQMPLTMPIAPPLTAHLLNRFLRGLEEADVGNRLLREHRQQVFRTILILGTLALVAYCARRLGKSRFRRDTRVPHTALAPAPVLADETPIEVRHQALVQSGNYWEPAQALARFFFEELSDDALSRGPGLLTRPGRTAQESRPTSLSAKSAGQILGTENFPSIQVHGGGWRRAWLRRQVRFAWNLAYGPPKQITARGLTRLPRTLDFLDREIREGRLILSLPIANSKATSSAAHRVKMTND